MEQHNTSAPGAATMAPASDVQETTSFNDANKGESVNFNPITDSTFFNDYNVGTDLQDFFKRPVLINTTTWVEGDNINTILRPWDLYFNDSRIKKKLDNFAFIACNLRIKVVINASPFYYGLARCSYRPLVSFEAGRTKDDGIGSSNFLELMALSQRPGFWIYPQENQGGDILAPYINYKDWLRVKLRSDFEDMGEFRMFSRGSLRNANSVLGQDVTIQVYAWAENVRVCGNTNDLALQAVNELSVQAVDEYDHDGVISGPASAVAKASGALEQMPVIGKYATATRMISSAIADVASWFGFTNTPVIDDVKPMKNLPYHSFASTEIGQPVDKLTLDPKNEVTIDPRSVGLTAMDDMHLSCIVGRESFLAFTGWDSADPVGAQLFSTVVRPNLFDNSDAANPIQTIVQGTPMSHVNHMFSYWRGDIIFRFQFVCSKFHRGRVQIVWDPTANLGLFGDTSPVAFTKVIDISEEKSYEMRVPYQQARSWLRCTNDISFKGWTDGATVIPSDGFDNGSLLMKVFTQQTSPSASSPVLIYISVRGAENLEFAAPTELKQNLSVYRYRDPPAAAASSSIRGLKVQAEAEDCITNCNPETLFPKSSCEEKLNLIYMGETVKSLRQLIRRTALSRVHAGEDQSGSIISVNESLFARTPLYNGFDPNAIHAALSPLGGGVPYNFVSNIPLTWMRSCFVGHRGSIRWQINTNNPEALGRFEADRNRRKLKVSDYNLYMNVVNTASYHQRIKDTTYNFLMNTGSSGLSLLNQHTQTGLSIEAPMYSPFRLLPNNPVTATLGQEELETDFDSVRVAYATKPQVQNNSNTDQYFYVSAGTDFGLYFFLNVPVIFSYNEGVPEGFA